MHDPDWLVKARAEGRITEHGVKLPVPEPIRNGCELPDPPKPAKYRNRKTVVDGIGFDSQKEANRYLELKFLEGQGRVRNLTLQERIPIRVNRILVCHYVADFVYEESTGKSWVLVTEDVKSAITRKNPVYRLKKKLLAASCGRQIREV